MNIFKKVYHWYLKRRYLRYIRIANMMLKALDKNFVQRGWSRQQRRQFWRDFIGNRFKQIDK